jgi:peptidoglycan-associated lipoprotein
MRSHAAAKVRVEGHCDERGTVEYNLALGSAARSPPATTL